MISPSCKGSNIEASTRRWYSSIYLQSIQKLNEDFKYFFCNDFAMPINL